MSSTTSSSASNPTWNWNDDAAKALGQDFCSDEQLKLAYSKIRQAVGEKLLVQNVLAPTNGRLPFTFSNEFTLDGVAISWPALQREVINLSMNYADPTVDVVTGLWTASGAPSGYSNSDPASWPPSLNPPNWSYKAVNDGKTPWPGPNGFTRKAPRQIRSMDATYVSGPTVVISNTSTNASAYSFPPVLSYTTGYATPAQEGDVARLTIELQPQNVPSPVSGVTYSPAIPALPATPIADYLNRGRYFKYTSGKWVLYTDHDAPVKALVTDYGPLMIGDYVGTWTIADLNTAINKFTRLVKVGLNNWPTGLTGVNGVSYEQLGDTYQNAPCGIIPSAWTNLGGDGPFADKAQLQYTGMPAGFSQRKVTFLGCATIGDGTNTYLSNEFFPSQNTIVRIGQPQVTCCSTLTSDMVGNNSPPAPPPAGQPGQSWFLRWTAVVMEFDQPAGFQYIASPQQGNCGGGCTPPVDCNPSTSTSTSTTTPPTTTSTTTTSTSTSTTTPPTTTSTSTSTTTPPTTTSTSTSTTSTTTTTSPPTTTTSTTPPTTSTTDTTTSTTTPPTTTTTATTTSTSTVTPTTVTSATTTTCGGVDVGASSSAHCFQLGSCGHWTAGANGHIHPVYNDAVGSMADNTGSFTLNWTTGGVSTTYTIAGTDASGPNIPVTAGATYSWTATGTIANSPSGNARYFSGGADGGNAPGVGTYCDSANYASLVALFTPLAAGEACDVCTDGRGAYSVGDSAMSSRCVIYQFTCVDIGATTSGQTGTFTDSSGAVYAWEDTGDTAPDSLTVYDPTAALGAHAPPSGVCTSGSNYISITRTA